jgi:flagellum-specific peptidoglycan hydrolase FlgJ
MAKLTPNQFVTKYWPDALAVQKKTGLSAFVILTQSAVESAWGSVAPGNNFFGHKDLDGKVNGNEQLLRTTEYLTNPDSGKKFPKVLSITQTGKRLWKYVVQDWFAFYKKPEEAFQKHADFFQKFPRYQKAWAVRGVPEKFLVEVSLAGYATDPNYSTTLLAVLTRIKKEVSALKLENS